MKKKSQQIGTNQIELRSHQNDKLEENRLDEVRVGTLVKAVIIQFQAVKSVQSMR